jgi:purine-nucleoside phosphorylase
VAHLHPTAELAERALLPDDPGQALALTRVLYGETPRMFNHHRGLWGYTGVALDGAPLTVQSTGIGGPSAAIVVTELHGLGLRRAVRIGRAWALDGALRAGELVAASAVVAYDGTSRALGAGERIEPDPALTAALQGDRCGLLASSDIETLDDASGALAFDLESAAVLAAAARAGIPAACLVAIEGAVDPDDVAARLGRAALAAIAPLRLT